MVTLSFSLLQVTVQTLRSVSKTTAATFGVLRSTLQILTALIAYPSNQMMSPTALTSVATAMWCVVSAHNLSFQPIQYIVKKNTIKGTINRQFPCFFHMPLHAGNIGIVYP